MHPLAPFDARDYLHRPRSIVTPCADNDLSHATASGRKQGRMPAEQPFSGELISEFLGGVEHHLNNAFDMAVSRRQGRGFHSEPARNRGADFSLVENFTFDLAGFEPVLGGG